MRTIRDFLKHLPSAAAPLLPAPAYTGLDTGYRTDPIMLAVESMRQHMTDEGWQIAQGLQAAGYQLCGHGLEVDDTDVDRILTRTHPTVVVIQDKREWDLIHLDFRDPKAKFTNVEALRDRPDIFKLTILKDAHQRADYHRGSAEEMGVHAWIVYYHPRIVKYLAPYVRKEHLIRTYHSIDKDLVPELVHGKPRCSTVLSGALSGAYPLRKRLFQEFTKFPDVTIIKHPGYHRKGCQTPDYLQSLALHRVAICTSSVYGYALRKIIEATACGCVVVTDLPRDEVLPRIDSNLCRIDSSLEPGRVLDLCRDLARSYSPKVQEDYAHKALEFYDYRAVGQRLADDIEAMRRIYNVLRAPEHAESIR